MTPDSIKELVKRLDENWGRRRIGDMSCLLADAADALEALEGQRDRFVERFNDTRLALQAAEAERDRLKAAASLFVNAYTEAHPMRTADLHSPGCVCMRCAFDEARSALKAKS